ncbi:MAG: hypothetical protein AAGJ19_15550 [Myxococcota bacterium]
MVGAGGVLGTRINTEHSAGVFGSNATIQLRREEYPGTAELGAVVAESVGYDRAQEHIAGVGVLQKHLRRSLPGHHGWLMIGHGADQPDTRITRYYRLCGSLRVRGIRLPEGRRSKEMLVERRGGLRWFGAIMCDCPDAERIVEVLRTDSGAALLWAPAGSQAAIEQGIELGWRVPDFGPPPELVRLAPQLGGLLMTLFGRFDDPEQGAVAFASPRLLEELRFHELG